MNLAKKCLGKVREYKKATVLTKVECKKYLQDESLTLEERWELLLYIDNVKSYLVSREEAPMLRDGTEYSSRHELVTYEELIDRVEDEGWEFVGEEEDYNNTRLTKEAKEEIKALKEEALSNGYVGCRVDW